MTQSKENFQQALSLYQEGKIEKALELLNRELEDKGPDPQVLFYKGLALSELERFDESIASFEKAIELDPEEPDYWSNFALSLYNAKRYDEALDAFDKTLTFELLIQDQILHYKALTLYQLCLNYEGGEPPMLAQTIRAFHEAIEAAPSEGASRYFLAELFRRFGRFEESLSVLDDLLEHVPTSVQAWYSKSANLSMLGRLDEALISLKKAAELDPVLAKEAWEDAAFDNLHSKKEFLSLIEEMALLQPKNYSQNELEQIHLKCHKAYSLFLEGKVESAISMIAELTQLHPTVPVVWSTWGMVFFKEGNFQEAAHAFKRSLQLDPYHTESWYSYAICLEELDNFDEALEALDKALADENLIHKADAWRTKGRLLAQKVTPEKKDLFQQSKEAFEKALSLNPNDKQIKVELALLYLEIYDSDQTIAILDEFDENEKEIYPLALFFKASAYAQKGSRQQMLTHLEKACALWPDLKDMALRESAFQPYLDDPNFQKILN